MSKEAKFIPLSELSDYSDAQLAWRVNLPEYAPKERIGINIDKIKLLSHIAGLDHLRVDSRSGEESTEMVSPNSVDAQGNATASSTISRTHAQLVNTEVDKPRGTYSEYIWGDGLITINTSEFNKRALDAARKENGASLRDPEEWAKLLDKSLTTGITKNANEQLLHNITVFSKYWLGLATFDTLFLTNHDFNPSSLLQNALEVTIISQGVQALMLSKLSSYPHPLRERRLSLIPGYQLDRLFVVHAITRTSKLAKVLK